MADDSTTVTFTVTGIERIHGAGRLVALATVEIELDGVILLVQGLRVMRGRNIITTQAPQFRDPRTGAWTPAVVLPNELGRAIARELHQELLRDPARCANNPLGTPLEALIKDTLDDHQVGDAPPIP
jgi:stage V sporulation protein G